MKKVAKLIYGLSACLLLTFVGCNNETEEVTPKAVAEKVTIASVEVPADVSKGILNNEMTVVTESDKDSIETELKDALASEALSDLFTEQVDTDITEYSRSMAYEDLPSLMEEYAEKVNKYYEDLQTNGSASMTFSKTPGQITGLKEGMDLSIPLIFIDMKTVTSGSQLKPTVAQSTINAISTSIGADLAKFEGFEDFFFKNIKVSTAVNVSNVIKQTTDLSNPGIFDSENFDSEDYESILENVKYSGYFKTENYYSIGGVFVTKNKVAGKLLVTADIKINIDDISKLMSFDEEDSSEMLNAISEYITVKFEAKAYDFEGNEICTLISTNNMEDLSDFMDIEDLIGSISNQGFN